MRRCMILLAFFFSSAAWAQDDPSAQFQELARNSENWFASTWSPLVQESNQNIVDADQLGTSVLEVATKMGVATDVCQPSDFDPRVSRLVGRLGGVESQYASASTAEKAVYDDLSQQFERTGRSMGAVEIYSALTDSRLRINMYATVWPAIENEKKFLGASAYTGCLIDRIAQTPRGPKIRDVIASANQALDEGIDASEIRIDRFDATATWIAQFTL